jgi:hypothetical protein
VEFPGGVHKFALQLPEHGDCLVRLERFETRPDFGFGGARHGAS